MWCLNLLGFLQHFHNSSIARVRSLFQRKLRILARVVRVNAASRGMPLVKIFLPKGQKAALDLAYLHATWCKLWGVPATVLQLVVTEAERSVQ